ncbi:MAG: molybdopterin-dependent oxidoreductase [Proteobacteria bacterium]|nr:molybdopterin-dependent oxidoreductase [Pseudomonadota bacterium]
MQITGLLASPKTLSYRDLRALPKRVLETVHICSGNPAHPTHPLRRASNVVWGGVDVEELLGGLGVRAAATHIWTYGLDHGKYSGKAVDNYVKDMPLSRLAEGDVLIAYDLNGAPLTPKNGFPARLVIPGFYGTNSVKWLGRLELADRRADSPFTTKYYVDVDLDADPSGKTTKPVWTTAPECVFVSPRPRGEIPLGAHELWGWSWSNCPIRTVEVSTDGGETWNAADVEAPARRSWQRFSYTWSPRMAGVYDIRCRTTDIKGQSQPADGARNAVFSIKVTVTDAPRADAASAS